MKPEPPEERPELTLEEIRAESEKLRADLKAKETEAQEAFEKGRRKGQGDLDTEVHRAREAERVAIERRGIADQLQALYQQAEEGDAEATAEASAQATAEVAIEATAEADAAASEIEQARAAAGERVVINIGTPKDTTMDATGAARSDIDAIRNEVLSMLPDDMDADLRESATTAITAGF